MTSAEILSNVFNNGIKPDSIISVSEWADANRVEQNRFEKHSPRFSFVLSLQALQAFRRGYSKAVYPTYRKRRHPNRENFVLHALHI